MAQAYKAPLMIDRYDAIVALRDVEIKQKRKDLIRLFDPLAYHPIKTEILEQLGQSWHKDVVELRKLILQIITEFPDNTSWRFVDGDHVFQNPQKMYIRTHHCQVYLKSILINNRIDKQHSQLH